MQLEKSLPNAQCAVIRTIFGVIFLPPFFIEGERSRQARERSRKAVRSSIGKLKVLLWVIKALSPIPHKKGQQALHFYSTANFVAL